MSNTNRSAPLAPRTPSSVVSSTRSLHASNDDQPHAISQSSPSYTSGSSSRPNDSAHQPQVPLSPGRKRRKVSRSKLGCMTCRKRRKLCDMARPACAACMRLKMECSWPPDSGDTSSMTPEHRLTSSRQARTSFSLALDGNLPLLSSRNPQPQLAYQSTPHHGMSLPTPSTNGDIVTNTNTHRNANMGDVMWGQPASSHLGSFDINPFPIPSVPTPLDDSAGLFDWLTGDGNLDEATLQLWAADCLAVPTTQTSNAFDPLNNILLNPTPPSHTELTVPLETAHQAAPSRHPSRAGSRRSTPSPNSRGTDTPTGASQAALLSYFHDSLSRLVSCTGDAAPSAFEAFTKLSNTTASRGPAGQGLHLSILAWAARHMVNRGFVKYEAVSEKFSSQAMGLINARMPELFDSRGKQRTLPEGHSEADTEYMTLLAAALMIMQFKICRGDVWGFSTTVGHLTLLVPTVYRPDGPDTQPDSMHHQFFENLLYHDVLGSFILNHNPIVPESIVNQYCKTGLETLNTLTGASLPLFAKMHRLAALVRQRRSKRCGSWSDDDLLDVVQPAMELEAALTTEKKRLDDLIISKPSISSHRYLHEAFRIACLLQLRCFVLGEPPCSLSIRLLVRQALSLLEAMCDQSLPGLCSAHWVIFIAALCAVGNGQEEGELDDRERVEQIYDDFLSDFGFLNVSRSRKIVSEVWAKNSNGNVFVDWLDVLAEFDWEIFVV